MNTMTLNLNFILPPAIAAIAALLQDDANENGDETEVASVQATIENMVAHLINRVGMELAVELLAAAGYEEME